MQLNRFHFLLPTLSKFSRRLVYLFHVGTSSCKLRILALSLGCKHFAPAPLPPSHSIHPSNPSASNLNLVRSSIMSAAGIQGLPLETLTQICKYLCTHCTNRSDDKPQSVDEECERLHLGHADLASVASTCKVLMHAAKPILYHMPVAKTGSVLWKRSTKGSHKHEDICERLMRELNCRPDLCRSLKRLMLIDPDTIPMNDQDDLISWEYGHESVETRSFHPSWFIPSVLLSNPAQTPPARVVFQNDSGCALSRSPTLEELLVHFGCNTVIKGPASGSLSSVKTICANGRVYRQKENHPPQHSQRIPPNLRMIDELLATASSLKALHCFSVCITSLATLNLPITHLLFGDVEFAVEPLPTLFQNTLPQLESLELIRPCVHDPFLRRYANLTSLFTALEPLAKTLKHLKIDGSYLPHGVATGMSQLTNLETLDVEGYWEASPVYQDTFQGDGVIPVAENFWVKWFPPNLRAFRFTNLSDFPYALHMQNLARNVQQHLPLLKMAEIYPHGNNLYTSSRTFF